MQFWFGNGAWASKTARQEIQQLTPDSVKSIAVIRHAALGDMVLTRPFLIELRHHFPHAKITLSLVSNYQRGAPEDLVDRIHVAYGSDRRDVSKKEQFRRARELGSHDLLFDLAATSRSFWLCALTKARLKIGFPYHILQQYVFYDLTVPRSDMRFEAEVMLDMLNAMGLKTEYPLQFKLPGDAYIARRHYAVYFTSASAQYKCWPEEYFAGLISTMAEQYPELDHIVLEGVGANESVAELMGILGPYSNVSSKQIATVDETIAFVKSASLVVANDTGIRHLAIAVDTPTIGLFFIQAPYSTSLFRYWPRFGQHEIASRTDGSWPSVDEVKILADKLLVDVK